MTHDSRPSQLPRPHLPLTGDVNIDHRARLALIEHEAAQRRMQQLEEQIALHNTPEQRIRAWERLHELDLPRRAVHPLVRVIAMQTHLTIEQVRGEQQRRLMPAQPAIRTGELPT